MRYLNTVYLTGYGNRIGYSKGSITVAKDGAKQRVPLQGIDGVVITGGAEVSIDALAECAAAGVRVASLRRTGAIRFVVAPPLTGNVHLRVAQVEASLDAARSLELAKLFVAAKLQNSRHVVSRWARDSEIGTAHRLHESADTIGSRLERLASAPTGDHVRGIEGDAARAYFAAMGTVLADSPFAFPSRNRRPPRDPVNALLGFCYGLIVSEITGAVQAVGLDHQVGYLHRARSGRPSLALDFAEELRALTDRFVVRLARRREISHDDFVVTPGGACYLNDEGRSKLFRLWESEKNGVVAHPVLGRDVERWALPTVQATLLARHLRGDLPVYPPFVLRG